MRVSFNQSMRFFTRSVPDKSPARLVESAAVGKRPSIIISDTYEVWIGNTTDAALNLTCGELFGFGTGLFEPKAVSALPSCSQFRFHGVLLSRCDFLL